METDNDDTHDAPDDVFDLPQDLPFDLPKEYETGDRLLLTGQIKRLAAEIDARKGQEGVAENCFMLAGPPGIGKSAIALYIAVRLFLSNEVVLYISDAGQLVGEAERRTGNFQFQGLAQQSNLWCLRCSKNKTPAWQQNSSIRSSNLRRS